MSLLLTLISALGNKQLFIDESRAVLQRYLPPSLHPIVRRYDQLRIVRPADPVRYV